MEWGATLSEFDPFFQYQQTQYVVDHGFASWFSWHITNEWYPAGRNVATSSFPGVAFSGAVTYYLARALGLNVSVMDVTIAFPVLAAAATCIVIFFLGREVGGNGVGLLAAFFLAISPAYIARTGLGFYDDETIGIMGILLVFLFYLKAMKNEGKLSTTILYAIAGGLSLGWVFISWGASRYPIALLALFTFFLLFTKWSTPRTILSYSILIAIGLGLAIMVPKLGLGFLKEFESVAALGVLLLLVINESSKRLTGRISRPTLLGISVAALGVGGILLWQLGIVNLSPTKFMSVINPFIRSDIPLIESVQEHRPATWASFYYQFGQLVFLAPLGIVFALRKLTYQKLFAVVFAVTMLYFSASLIRLTTVLAPAFAILGALATVEIVKTFSNISVLQNVSRRRQRLTPRLGRGFSAFLILTIFAISLVPFGRSVDSAYTPTTLAASSIPSRQQIGDWMQALQWMKNSLPENTVIASWWDYGYWISVMGDQISLADNGTINMTQIEQIGKLFMSTENDSLPILDSYNASYVLVFTTINQAQSGNYLFGDEVKWRWMAKIGWNNNTYDQALADTSITSMLAEAWSQSTTDTTKTNWYDQFKTYAMPKPDRVLTKLIFNGAFPSIDTQIPELSLTHFQLAFASSENFVLIYKIIY
jgi:dolichyl-diphosphooligosaccharide--protein glycosyltransferase